MSEHVVTPKRKVIAYVTWGRRLLVFRHLDLPDAGIQAPAGTMKESEPPEVAVLREVREETGLTEVTIVRVLGVERRDMTEFGLNEVHQRHFYHLRCEAQPQETWTHREEDPDDGGDEAIRFEFFWAPILRGLPRLAAGQDAMFPRLVASLDAD